MKKSNKKNIILDVEYILNKGNHNSIYKQIKKTYNEYKKDDYHDLVTDELYLTKLNGLLDKYYQKSNILITNIFIVVFSIVVIFAGYFITDYYNRIHNIGNNIIENNNNFLLISYENLNDITLTREKSKIKINLKSLSANKLEYRIYAITDEITNINYDVILNSINYGTNVLKSKRQLLFKGLIKPKEFKTIDIDLWQIDNYNLNSQLRFYVDSSIIK